MTVIVDCGDIVPYNVFDYYEPNAHDFQQEKVEKCEDQQQHKSPVVAQAYTLINYCAMVVEPVDTRVAEFAVRGVGRLHKLTSFTFAVGVNLTLPQHIIIFILTILTQAI